nr:ALPV-052 [Albatrosspox virus]
MIICIIYLCFQYLLNTSYIKYILLFTGTYTTCKFLSKLH